MPSAEIAEREARFADVVGPVVVRTVQAGERVLPEQIGPHPPSRMAVSGERRVSRSYLDDCGPFAIREEVVEGEVLGLLRQHEQETLVTASAVGAGDSNKQGILDREEVGEVVEQVDVTGFDLGGDRDRGTAVLPTLPDPEDRGHRVAALHPPHRVEVGGLHIGTADHDRIEACDVESRGKRRTGEDVAVAMRDPFPLDVGRRVPQAIAKLRVAVHDPGADIAFAKLFDDVVQILVDRSDLGTRSAWTGAADLLGALPPALLQLHPEEPGVGAQGCDGLSNLAAKRSGRRRSGTHGVPPG